MSSDTDCKSANWGQKTLQYESNYEVFFNLCLTYESARLNDKVYDCAQLVSERSHIKWLKPNTETIIHNIGKYGSDHVSKA